MKETVGEKFSDAKETVGEKFSDVKETVGEKLNYIKENADGTFSVIVDIGKEQALKLLYVVVDRIAAECVRSFNIDKKLVNKGVVLTKSLLDQLVYGSLSLTKTQSVMKSPVVIKLVESVIMTNNTSVFMLVVERTLRLTPFGTIYNIIPAPIIKELSRVFSDLERKLIVRAIGTTKNNPQIGNGE